MMLICDLETTSLNVFEAEIITGYFMMVRKDFKVIASFEIKCNPFKWSFEAQLIHGITQEQASEYPRFNKVYQDLLDWIETYKPTEFWCHSNSKMYGKIVPYDYAVLRLSMFNMGDYPYFKINALKPFSTHSLAKVLQHHYNFEGFSLNLICKDIGINLKHHDAKSDCVAAYKILRQLLPQTSREALIQYERGLNDIESTSTKHRKRSQKEERLFG